MMQTTSSNTAANSSSKMGSGNTFVPSQLAVDHLNLITLASEQHPRSHVKHQLSFRQHTNSAHMHTGHTMRAVQRKTFGGSDALRYRHCRISCSDQTLHQKLGSICHPYPHDDQATVDQITLLRSWEIHTEV
jgi:hypothetical protein